MDSPLVNEYKQSFILKRLLQTFFGGPKLFLGDASFWYFIVMQGLLFISLFSILVVCTVVFPTSSTSDLVTSLSIGAAATSICCLVLHLLAYLITRKDKTQKNEYSHQARDNFSEGETISLDGPFGCSTWQTFMPSRSHFLFSLLHAAVAAITAVAAIYSCKQQAIMELLQISSKQSLALMLLSLFSSTTALYGLIGAAPAEPAVYLPHLRTELSVLSRPAHIVTFALLHLLHSCYPSQWLLFLLNWASHITMAIASILWVLGSLPPIDAYFLWLMEYCLVALFGGSPAASTSRLLLQMTVECVTFAGLLFLSSHPTLAIVAAMRGLLLSTDYVWLARSLRKAPEVKMPQFSALKESLLLLLLLLVTFTISLVLTSPHSHWFSSRGDCDISTNTSGDGVRLSLQQIQDMPLMFTISNKKVMLACTSLLSLLLLSLVTLRQAFLWGVFTNPLWSEVTLLPNRQSLHFILTQALTIGSPLLCLLVVHMFAASDHCLVLSAPVLSMQYTVSMLAIARAFRMIWTHPLHSCLQLSVFSLLELFLLPSMSTVSSFSSLMPWFANAAILTTLDASSLVRLLLLCNVWRVCVTVWRHLLGVTVLVTSSVSNVKQRKNVTLLLAGACIIGLPFLMFEILLASVLMAPILPVFTLPLYILGFPRPRKFWPYPVGHSANHCADSVYYHQMSQGLAVAVNCQMQSGVLGLCEAGDHFLLRFEDRFIWVQVLEVGFLYSYYSIKGLELQETSCHTAEASKVDSIFSRAFDVHEDSSFFARCTNNSFFHTLTPITRMPVVTYCDTKNVLTGVIDSQSFLKVVPDYFIKNLLYLLMESTVEGVEEKTPPPVVQPDNNQEVVKAPEDHKPTGVLARTFTPDSFRSFGSEGKPLSSRDHWVRLLTSEENRSLQSGRGSRMAWADTSNLQGTSAIEGVLSPTEVYETRLQPIQAPSPIGGEGKGYGMRGRSRNAVMPNLLFDDLDMKDSVMITEEEEDISDLKSHIGSIRSKGDDIVKNPHKVNSSGRSYQPSGRSYMKSQKSYHASSIPFAPPTQWLTGDPIVNDVLEGFQTFFPLTWYRYLLGHFHRMRLSLLKEKAEEKLQKETLSSKKKNKNSSAGGRTVPNSSVETKYGSNNNPAPTLHESSSLEELVSDESLEESYRQLLCFTYSSLMQGEASPSSVLSSFGGQVSHASCCRWLAERPALRQIVVRAFRMSVKMSLDHVLIGLNNANFPDLLEAFVEYSTMWFCGPDESKECANVSNVVDAVPPPGDENTQPPSARRRMSKASNVSDKSPEVTEPSEGGVKSQPSSWQEAVEGEVPNLFSIGYNEEKGVYTSHLATLQSLPVSLGRLSDSIVTSIWSALVPELLYLTNDDDERYSIQAHSSLLRNLSTQAADPPLGYPVYSSPAMRMGAEVLRGD